MSALKRDITISVGGVQFIVTVLCASTLSPEKEPRRWCTRLAGSKQQIDEVLSAHVLAELDRRIKGGKLEDQAELVYDVPMRGGAA